MTFLIIDDSYIDRLVSSMLIKRTYNTERVFEASGGRAGLDWIAKNCEVEKIIILLDIMMPQMNGFQFLEEFKSVEESIRAKVTIIMLSSTLDESDRQRAKEHPNVKKLLSKPLSPNELRDLVPGPTA